MRSIDKKVHDFVVSTYPLNGSRFCSNKLGISIKEIKYLVKRFEIRRIYNLVSSISYENINCPHFAYFLGLFWADGHVRKKGNTISLSLVEKDALQIKNSILINVKFRIRRRQSTNNGLWNLEFIGTDKSFRNFLVNNDYLIKSGASADKILSRIPAHLKHYWWRGYSDGDGCFYHYPGNKGLNIGHNFSGCHHQDWSFVENLYHDLNIIFHVRKNVRSNGYKSSTVEMGSKTSLLRLGNYLYQGYENDKIGFHRKWNKFMEIVSLKALSKERVRRSKYKYISYDKSRHKWGYDIQRRDNRLKNFAFASEEDAYTHLLHLSSSGLLSFTL